MRFFGVLSLVGWPIANAIKGTCDHHGPLVEMGFLYDAIYTNADCAKYQEMCLGCRDVTQVNFCRIDWHPKCKTEFNVQLVADLYDDGTFLTPEPDKILFPGPWIHKSHSCGFTRDLDGVKFVQKETSSSDNEDPSTWEELECDINGRQVTCNESMSQDKAITIAVLNATTNQPLTDVSFAASCTYVYDRVKPARAIPRVTSDHAKYTLHWQSDCSAILKDKDECLESDISLDRVQLCLLKHKSTCHIPKIEIKIQGPETHSVEARFERANVYKDLFVPLVFVDQSIFQVSSDTNSMTINFDSVNFNVKTHAEDLYWSKKFGGDNDGKLLAVSNALQDELANVNKRVSIQGVGGRFVFLDKSVNENQKIIFSSTFTMQQSDERDTLH